MSDLRADSNLLSLPTQRNFLRGAGAAMLVPGRAWARMSRVSASNRITLGVIGWGMIGPTNTKAFLQQSDCQVVAACDLDKIHLQSAVDTINNRYGTKDCKAYQDYRELLGRDDIDAVMIAVPDHWHALIATEAPRRSSFRIIFLSDCVRLQRGLRTLAGPALPASAQPKGMKNP